MAQSIQNLADGARAALDTAYANNPEGDIEQMKSDALNEYLLPDSDTYGWLALASVDPSELIIDNTNVYEEMFTRGQAIIQAALDDEANILTNP